MNKILVTGAKGFVGKNLIVELKNRKYFAAGNNLEVGDIPVEYTHKIENSGTSDRVKIMWTNEAFDPEKPDTYFDNLYLLSGETNRN